MINKIDHSLQPSKPKNASSFLETSELINP